MVPSYLAARTNEAWCGLCTFAWCAGLQNCLWAAYVKAQALLATTTAVATAAALA